MQVVCEATQNPSVAVQVGAFECLVLIMGLYYDKMPLYMEQALFGVRIPTPCILVTFFDQAF
jgi:importin subunit beta-1